MGNCYNYTPIPPAETSCIIAHLFVELALPCSCCKREDGVISVSVDFNASFSGSAETFGARMTETPASMTASMKETGGGSASNYEALRNKPKINGHELIGDMTPAQLGITDDRHHTHKQAQAAKVWTIAHNLGKRPAVTVVDSAGTVVIGEIDYLDDNTVRLAFCAAFSGTAYFN